MENKSPNNNSPHYSVTSYFLCNLTLLFMGLRFCNVIDWSWVWVMAPLWIPLVIVLFFCIIGILVGGNDDD
jgi:hypothetical protein